MQSPYSWMPTLAQAHPLQHQPPTPKRMLPTAIPYPLPTKAKLGILHTTPKFPLVTRQCKVGLRSSHIHQLHDKSCPHFKTLWVYPQRWPMNFGRVWKAWCTMQLLRSLARHLPLHRILTLRPETPQLTFRIPSRSVVLRQQSRVDYTCRSTTTRTTILATWPPIPPPLRTQQHSCKLRRGAQYRSTSSSLNDIHNPLPSTCTRRVSRGNTLCQLRKCMEAGQNT